jgi:hypothetical protein
LISPPILAQIEKLHTLMQFRAVFRRGQKDFRGAKDMESGKFSPVIQYIRRIAAGQASHLSDSALLDRFNARHDEEAFAVLLQRHGRLVLATCRRVTEDWHATEDCFQAAFLVLATKANSLRPTESLGPWLHAVATRVALKATHRPQPGASERGKPR